jgi:heme-degrading monooxygenase HmoA
MIVRRWVGVVPTGKADAYTAYLHQTGLGDYAATVGNRGVTLLTRAVEQGVEFTTLTFWGSMDAIRAFAGDRPELARYYPEDDEFLLWREEYVDHFEVPFARIPALDEGA